MARRKDSESVIQMSRKEVCICLGHALQMPYLGRWTHHDGKIVSPLIPIGHPFRVALHFDSLWRPTVTVQGGPYVGSMRIRWPWGRAPVFLRAWIKSRTQHRQDLVLALKRVQGRRSRK
jgi:hypothetical protein